MEKFSIFENKYGQQSKGELTLQDAHDLITLKRKLSDLDNSRIVMTSDWWPYWVKQIRDTKDKTFKDKIPAFTFYGVLSTRRELVSASGYYAIDIDRNPDDLGEDNSQVFDRLGYEGVKSLATNMPSTVLCFRSPSGNGIKVVHKIEPMGIDLTDVSYVSHEVFKHFKKMYADLGIYIDKQCKDWNRLCYFSYDRSAYLNESASSECVYIEKPVVLYDGTAKVFSDVGSKGYILSKDPRNRDQNCPHCDGGSKRDRSTFTYYVDENGDRIGDHGVCCREKCAVNKRPESNDQVRWHFLGKKVGTQDQAWLSKEDYIKKKREEEKNKTKNFYNL